MASVAICRRPMIRAWCVLRRARPRRSRKMAASRLKCRARIPIASACRTDLLAQPTRFNTASPMTTIPASISVMRSITPTTGAMVISAASPRVYCLVIRRTLPTMVAQMHPCVGDACSFTSDGMTVSGVCHGGPGFMACVPSCDANNDIGCAHPTAICQATNLLGLPNTYGVCIDSDYYPSPTDCPGGALVSRDDGHYECIAPSLLGCAPSVDALGRTIVPEFGSSLFVYLSRAYSRWYLRRWTGDALLRAVMLGRSA